jgi:hypothetical protein
LSKYGLRVEDKTKDKKEKEETTPTNEEKEKEETTANEAEKQPEQPEEKVSLFFLVNNKIHNATTIRTCYYLFYAFLLVICCYDEY